MRKNLFIFACIVSLAFAASLNAQTIQSTTTGGRWTEGSTWIGGVVPTASHDVVVNGPVRVFGSAACRNITISTGATLESDGAWSGTSTLTITGSITNNGLVRNTPAGGWALHLEVSGNVTNNGTWTPWRTSLTGTSTQTLSLGSLRKFESEFVKTQSAGSLVASSALTFTTAFTLGNSTLNLQNNALILEGSGNISNGAVLNTGDLTLRAGARLDNITYRGSPNLKGLVRIRSSGVAMEGTVTVVDTLESDPGWSGTSTLTITGSITNNGLVRNTPWGGWALHLSVSGGITNNGTWIHSQTNLTGRGTRTLTLGAGKKFESVMAKTDSAGVVTANSSLAFTRSFNLARGILDMQSRALTLETGSGNIHNGIVLNTGDLTLRNDARLDNITYRGNPNLKGIVRIRSSGVAMEGTVTVVDTLESDPGWSGTSTLTITGSITNNGLVRNTPWGGWALHLSVSGGITNNGTWIHSQTNLTGRGTRTLTLGAGKKFESVMAKTDSAGVVTANSSLAFTQSFNLAKGMLDMQSRALTLETGSGNISNGAVLNTGDLTLRSGARLDNITYRGSPNLKGLVRIRSSGVAMDGTVTVVDTLESDPGWSGTSTLTITGSIINNGLVWNTPWGGWPLHLSISGSITNNGTWIHSQTNLTGRGTRTLMLGAGKKFESVMAKTDSAGVVTANSSLAFTQSFNLAKGMLDMQSRALTLETGSGNIHNGIVLNTGDLTLRSGARLDNITYRGSPNLKGIVRIRSSGVAMEGTVTVVDTLESDPGWSGTSTLTIIGSITNNGLVRNTPWGGWALHLSILGSITNNRTWTASTLGLAGSGERTIRGAGITSTIRSVGTKVTLTGDNFLPNLTVVSPSRCILENGTLRVEPGTISGTLENRGQIITRRRITTTQDYGFFAATARIVTGSGLDTLTFFSHGHQVPQTFANAVKSWWRVSPIPSTVKGTIASLTLSYTDAELGSHNEANIQLYHSADSGKSWTQVSTSLNTTRNAAANTIAVTSVPAWGDFLVSAVADPISVRPSIVVSVIGSPQIRVLAPNRYTVHYVNNSDFPTDDFLLAVNVGEWIRILRTEHPQADGRLEVVPFDSLSFAGEDSTFVFYAAGMGPREERTFNVIATAKGTGLGKTSGILVEPLTVTVGAFLIKSAVTGAIVYATVKTIDYVGSKAKEGLELTPEQKRQWEQHIGEIPQEIKRKDTKKEWAMKKVGGMIIEKSMGFIGGTVDVARAVGRNLKEVAPNLRRRVFGWLYKESGLYGVEEKVGDITVKIEVSGATQVKKQRVTSWDPNEKVAPAGYGPQGFISTAGRMNYKILFENLKTAQAPAWRVIIVDTLLAEFDPASVEFGTTSHEGPTYEWRKTRTGNILRWEIEGIELPPNRTPPEGEGYVTFTVMPRANLPSGTAFRNRAEIVFDLNKPIITNTVVNTLDFTPPTTTMRPLPATHNRDSLVVRWHSSDGPLGSGVESVALFASKDGGPFVQVGMTFADSIKIKVTNGEYRFYGLATDNVGNVESVRPAVVQTVVSVVVNVEAEQLLPQTFELLQNYPNPFNPSTTIKYSLPVGSRVNLKIFNLLGQEVRTLVDEVQDAGYKSLTWDGLNSEGMSMASGVYFYRMEAVSLTDPRRAFLEVRKMLLLR